jgi:D-amino peptidase
MPHTIVHATCPGDGDRGADIFTCYGARSMKVFLSFDMEGVAGIVDWEQCIGAGPSYEIGRRLTLGEVNAAIDGAMAGGASELVVNDSHWTMRNLAPDELHGGATYLSGRHKPGYMTEGLDGSFDAAFFVGYHGSAGTSSVLSHTYNPNAIMEVRLNGHVAGEAAVNALVAQHHGVPLGLITGDGTTAEETRWFAPDAERVVVKDSITRFAARSLHPDAAREAIRRGATSAIRAVAAGRVGSTLFSLPAKLEIDLMTEDMAEMATWLRSVDRSGRRTVTIEGGDALATFRAFVAVVYLTRQAEGR